jgi:branched-chain amino acid transport system permease protein
MLDLLWLQGLALQAAVLGIFALSYWLLIGLAGLVSFGHALHLGMGGYAMVHLINALHGVGWLPPVLLMPVLGLIGGALIALLLGPLTVRHGGTAFAMITLGLAELAQALASRWLLFSGGESGIRLEPVLGRSGWDSPLLVAGLWFALVVFLVASVVRSPLGQYARASRDQPDRLATLGIEVVALRLRVYVLAGGLAGVAGALWVLVQEMATLELFGAARSATALLVTVIGGIGHWAGALLGTLLHLALSQGLSRLLAGWPLYLGLLFMMLIVLRPQGLISLWQEPPTLPWWRSRALGLAVLLPGVVVLVELAYLRAQGDPVRDTFSLGAFTWRASAASDWWQALLLCLPGLGWWVWRWARGRAP